MFAYSQDYKGTPADFLKIMNNKEFETYKVSRLSCHSTTELRDPAYGFIVALVSLVTSGLFRWCDRTRMSRHLWTNTLTFSTGSEMMWEKSPLRSVKHLYEW
jgi:hypothetical protein